MLCLNKIGEVIFLHQDSFCPGHKGLLLFVCIYFDSQIQTGIEPNNLKANMKIIMRMKIKMSNSDGEPITLL